MTTGSMSVHETFSENLRTLCGTKGTIARVCADLGINRQQFNKYLSGAAFPSAAVLAKIASYFDVDELELLQSPASLRLQLARSQRDWKKMLAELDAVGGAAIAQVLETSEDASLKPGCYMVYYPWVLDNTKLVRAVMVVFKSAGRTYFRRYTRLRNVESGRKSYTRARHEGIVLEDVGRFFLLAKNSRGYGELSLVSFGASARASHGVYHGVAQVMSSWGEPLGARVTISYEGDITRFRNLLKQASVGPVGEGEVDPVILKSIQQPLASNIPAISAYRPESF